MKSLQSIALFSLINSEREINFEEFSVWIIRSILEGIDQNIIQNNFEDNNIYRDFVLKDENLYNLHTFNLDETGPFKTLRDIPSKIKGLSFKFYDKVEDINDLITSYEFNKFTCLEYIDLACFYIDKGAVKRICEIKTITSLDLECTYINAEEMAYFSELPNLTYLNIYGNPIYTMKYISEISTLEELDIGECRLWNKSIRYLEKLNKLHTLSLSRNHIGDEGVESILKLSNLRRLDVSYSKIGDKGITSILNMKNLEYLDVQGTRVTKDIIECIKKSRPELKIVN